MPKQVPAPVPTGSEKLPPVFVDTSILIARTVHGPETKRLIGERLARHSSVVTSLVCRQEFKRRLLAGAEYLLKLLERYGDSVEEVYQHLIRLPANLQKTLRLKNVCLQLWGQIESGSAAGRLVRTRRYLKSLLVAGLVRFDQQVDQVVRSSGCGCGKRDLLESARAGTSVVGETKCSRLPGTECGIVAFLVASHALRVRLLGHLRALPESDKTDELRRAETFLAALEKDAGSARAQDPCLTAGDLLIALESAGAAEWFYTLNSRESQHLCRAVGQNLVVRPANPEQADIVCEKHEAAWPGFGKKRPAKK